MKKNVKNEELQSRREFFKKAAKGMLPMIGAIALASSPVLSQAAKEISSPCDCSGACSGTCRGSCKGTCDGACMGGCKGTCTGTCSGSCTGTCRGGCSGN